MSDNKLPSIDGYDIVKKLGQGGMGSVYAATQQSSGRNVALKVMSATLGDDAVWAKRFIKEAQIVAQLSHPNIVPVYDVGICDGHFFIAMEAMTGGDLESRITAGMSVSEVLHVMVNVAAGLDFAGEKGFVHRDIKPDNVMFREDGTPVILDFGIVKQKDDQGDKMTQTGTVIGTSDYMSPEQAQGEKIDERSDIYSLGCMVYELLTGRPPYQADSAVAVLLKHINEPPPKLPASLSALQPLIDKSMAKKVEDRYSRAQELITDVQKLAPQIKALITESQRAVKVNDRGAATRVSGAVAKDQATIVAATITGDAGSSIKTGASAKSQTPAKRTASAEAIATAENELSDILKSAKDTIQSHSVESKNKKAKRAKIAAVFASIIVLGAVGFAAYQQFYLAPLELERAAKMAAQKSQEKVNAILADADVRRAGILFSDLNAVDELVALYRRVLTIDPDNKQAELALSNMGEVFVGRAKDAVADENIELAVNYRDYAERLSPNSEGLVALRAAIITARQSSAQREMETKFQQRKIESLLNEATAEIESGAGFSEGAYATLKQVLSIDENNEQATNQIKELLDSLFASTQSDIDQQQFNSAQSKISQLKRYDYDAGKVAALQLELKSTRSVFLEKQRNLKLASQKQELLKQAQRLQREPRSIRVNEELREIYSTILKTDASNADALAGMMKVSRYDVSLALAAIQERDYARAQQHIASIQSSTPRHARLSELSAELMQAQRNSKQADDLIAGAKKMLQSTTPGEGGRALLLDVYSTLQTVQDMDKNNPQLAGLLASLEDQYVLAIQQLMAASDNEQLEQYFNDVAGKSWPSDRLFQLQLSHQNTVAVKKKKPRVLTGGF